MTPQPINVENMLDHVKAYKELEAHFKTKASQELFTLIMCTSRHDEESPHTTEARILNLIQQYGEGKIVPKQAA